MPGINGMELVQRIKPVLPNIRVIFITSHLEYAIDSFELNIFRYVPKNDLDKRLHFAVSDALKLIMLEDTFLIAAPLIELTAAAAVTWIRFRVEHRLVLFYSCSSLGVRKPAIYLTIRRMQNILVIKPENSSPPPVYRRDGCLETSIEDPLLHGWGVKNRIIFYCLGFTLTTDFEAIHTRHT